MSPRLDYTDVSKGIKLLIYYYWKLNINLQISSEICQTTFWTDYSRESTIDNDHSDRESEEEHHDPYRQKKVKFPKKPDNLIPDDDKGTISEIDDQKWYF